MAEHQIAKRRDEWITAVNNRDLEGYVSLVSEHVVWIPPGQVALEGRQEFREWLGPFFQDFRYAFQIPNCSINVNGNWAVEKGMFDTTLTAADGREMHHTGRYIVIWHLELDGVWYIDRYVDYS